MLHAVTLGLLLAGGLVGEAPEPTPSPEASEPTPGAEAPPSPAPAPAEDPAALAAAAELAFAEGRFDDVVELAGRAHALTGDPVHLYAQALAERRRGRCRDALVLYARVLAAVQDDPAYAALVNGARQGIKLCEDELEPAPTPTPTPAPVPVVAPAPVAEAARVDHDPRPWYRDPWGGVLVGVGVGAVAGAGGTLWALSVREARAAERAPNESAYADELVGARALRAGAVASFGVGGALLVGAVIRYVVVQRRSTSPRSSPAVGVVPVPAGLVVGWRAIF